MRNLQPIIAAMVLQLAGTAAGAQTVDLRGPAPRQGTIVQNRVTTKMPTGTVTIESGGTVSRAQARSEGVAVHEVEVLQAESRQITMLKYRVAEDWRRDSLEFAGAAPQNTVEDGPLVGETVLIERHADGWTKTLLGRQPDAKQGRWLREAYVPNSERYPAKPVAVGESWVLDGPKLLAVFGYGEALSAEGKATFTLDRVSEQGGQRHAVISYRLELKARILDDQDSPLELAIGGTGKVQRSLVSHLDTSDHFTGQQHLSGSVMQGGARANLTIAGALEVEAAEHLVGADARATVARRGTDSAAVATATTVPRRQDSPQPSRSPGSRPSCRGAAVPCNQRQGFTCNEGIGCFDAGTCSGVATEFCFNKSQFSCNMTPGCFWQSWSNTCGGSVSCGGKAQFQCASIAGCRWQSSCTGTATPCEALNERKCRRQTGCSFE